jgi:hypothetical protein
MNSREQEEALFEEARQLADASARKAFLDQACAGRTALRTRIDSLLTAGAAAEDFFQAATSGDLTKRLAEGMDWHDVALEDQSALLDGLNNRIGNYKLLQKIGEGGCGVVYMAEQEKPIRRRVALKIIKLGMDTKSVIARFEAERQALAMMDHPNIARVLDAGATETGRPYFVMELVRGIKITDYCNDHQLDTRQRLNLFIQICAAIQHAHQKGIIHRDIKPSNILVTLSDGRPVPKVIDFGIAKAIEVRLTDKTLFTAYEQLIGTPAYMSPEQAAMSEQDVDTRSDIYSLGVLLYELLTGRTPFDPKKLVQDGPEAMRRTLREQEPPRPSTMVTTLLGAELTTMAAQRLAEPPRLISLLRGDLDWIVMKALEKDRKRRYETANRLAMDIECHLNDEPVSARPPSRRYRFQRLVRRNKLVFVAGGAVALALFAGLGASIWLFLQEHDARERAVRAEQQQVQLRREAEEGRLVEMQLRQQAEAREKISEIMMLISQNKFQAADDLLSQVVLSEPTLDGASVMRSLGEWHALQKHWPEAAARYNQLLLINKFDNQDAVTLDYLEYGAVLAEMGDLKKIETLRQDAITRFGSMAFPFADRIIKVSLLLPAPPETITSLSRLFKVTLLSYKKDSSGDQVDTFRSAWECIPLALTEYRRGNFPQGEMWIRRSLTYSDVNPSRVATAHILLAMALQQQHETDTARAELAEGQILVEDYLRTKPDRGNMLHGFWFDWVYAQTLLHEAQGLISPV